MNWAREKREPAQVGISKLLTCFVKSQNFSVRSSHLFCEISKLFTCFVKSQNFSVRSSHLFCEISKLLSCFVKSYRICDRTFAQD